MNHSHTPPAHQIDAPKMMALSDAERLAYQRPGKTVVVYARTTPPPQGAWTNSDSLAAFTVRPADEPAPEGTTVLTTVTRHPCEVPGRVASLGSVVRQVLANLPTGVVLADRAIVEHYPRRLYDTTSKVFAYELLSTEGLNVATWIPDTAINGAMMQMGYDGRGRPWKDVPAPEDSSVDIARHIADAKRSPLAREVMNWWSYAQNEVDGDRNIFDFAPDFVAGAESGRPDMDIAAAIAKWWPNARSMTSGEGGEWNVFHVTPAFVVMAKLIKDPAAEVAPEPVAPTPAPDAAATQVPTDPEAPRRPRPR